MTALVGGGVKRNLSVVRDLGGITRENFGGVAVKPHDGPGQDNAEFLKVRREVGSARAREYHLLAVAPPGRKNQRKQAYGETERKRGNLSASIVR